MTWSKVWSLAFCYSGVLPKMRLNRRTHFHALHKHDQEWHWRIKAAVGRDIPPEPLQHAKLELVRYSVAKRIDPDGLSASWKPVIDGLRHAKVLAEDSTENVELISRHERIEHRRDQRIGVSVTELQS